MDIDKRIKILICLGAAVATNCPPCVQIFLGKAKDNGIDDQDIKTAITLGVSVKKGAVVKHDEFIATLNGGIYSSQENTEESCSSK
jgi:Uncharacterized homolog of gamma-carboxymuconolactone decarboxylase subunit